MKNLGKLFRNRLLTYLLIFTFHVFCFFFRFCKRHADYLSPDFSIGARLPDHLEDRSNRFKLVLQQLIREKSFGPGQIGSMDELPLHLTPSIRDKRLGTTGWSIWIWPNISIIVIVTSFIYFIYMLYYDFIMNNCVRNWANLYWSPCIVVPQHCLRLPQYFSNTRVSRVLKLLSF